MSIPDGVFETYRLFDITEFKVWNIKGLRHRDISNRGGIWNFRLLVVQPLYTMTHSEILPGGIIIRRSVLKVIV